MLEFDVLLQGALRAVAAVAEVGSADELALNFLGSAPHPLAVFSFGVVVRVILELGVLVWPSAFMEVRELRLD